MVGEGENGSCVGNDLYKGNLEGLLSTFTAEHFPNLQSLDMSCRNRKLVNSSIANGISSIHITADMFPAMEKLSLDSNLRFHSLMNSKWLVICYY